MLLQLDSAELIFPRETGEIYTERRYALPISVEEAWPLFSNTDWLNRALGLGANRYRSRRTPEGELRIDAETAFLGGKLRWRERPFQWLRPKACFGQRDYENGPILRLRAGFDLWPQEERACSVRFVTTLLPRNELGAMLIRALILPASGRQLDRTMARLVKTLSFQHSEGGELPPMNRTPVDATALANGLDRLRLLGGFEPQEVARLGELLRTVDDVEAARLRPFVVARRWAEPKWDVVRLFLHATRAGLLDLSWEVLCPSCGEDGAPKQRLSELRGRMHCETCEVGFGAEFDRSVELKFAINPAVRAVQTERFCLGGVNFRQSIVAQLTAPPGETTTLDWPLEPGRYRFKSDVWERGIDVSVSAITAPQPGTLRIIWRGRDSAEVDPEAFSGERIQVENQAKVPLVLRVEKVADADEVLTAREVTNWQEFRDLFSSEVLSPGEQLVVGRQILLFTDLRGSTELYQSLGDAHAYSRVREHFAILTEVLRRHRGGLVKTIGDAVMAVFSSIHDGLTAVVEMHQALASYEKERNPDAPLRLKAALHAGACLTINANGVLDCFGTTVNYAARLLGESGADCVALSDEVYQTEEAKLFLEKAGLRAESRNCELRGFATEQLVWRVKVLD